MMARKSFFRREKQLDENVLLAQVISGSSGRTSVIGEQETKWEMG